ncbi:MAG: Glutamate synthase [NADPH] large chain [Burkholderia gladioli]|nr:MAG: Glutamate synthase [NADPH] large chain [Burkholderia gladioli]
MSYGSLSANAIRALNLGAKKGGFAHDTGEGSLSKYHREHGGDIIWEIASGYFGCRNDDGTFNADKYAKQAADPQVKMIEVKLSQGAKPGHGGVLLAAKITPEIAETRGIPMGRDCISPASHSEFSTPRSCSNSSRSCARCRAASRRASSSASAIRGNSSASPRPCSKPASCRTSSWWTAPRAAPARHRSNSPITWACRCRKGCCGAQHAGGHRPARAHKIGASGKIITAFDIARTLAIGADWVN